MGASAHRPSAQDRRSPDLERYSFSESGPWVVDPAHLTWSSHVERLRQRAQAEVPRLTRRRRLPPSGRIARVAGVLTGAVGTWYATDRRRGQARSRLGLSRRLRLGFERLGPTYIKLGQILSSGEGIFPVEVVSQFKMLRDRVPPEAFETVVEMLEEELAGPLGDTFSYLDPTPVAAASIAQVHRGVLRSGEEVVVKVQRPRVAELVRRDLAVMSFIAPFLTGRIPVSALANPPALIELFAETIVEELDFRLEAANMLDIAEVLALTGQRSIIVPRPHPVLVTRRMLVMERLSGFGWDDVGGMQAAGIDTAAVLRSEVISFLEGALLYGVFHGDLHAGNLFVEPGGRVALLDHGIMGRLDEPQRQAFLRLLVGGTTNDVETQIEALRTLGAVPGDARTEDLIRDLGLDKPAKDITLLSAEELTAQIRDLVKALLSYGVRMPKELMLFVKDLLFLDAAVARMAPEIDLLGEVAVIASYFAQHHGERIAAEVGLDMASTPIDLDGLRASMGLSQETREITYRELQERREVLRTKFDSPGD
ncbi:MAG: ABC1 kinase family protein [Acidimicrobiales bacterium]